MRCRRDLHRVALRMGRELYTLELGRTNLSVFDRELEVLQQLRTRPHHGVAPAEDAARRVVPRRVAAEHQIAVPQGVDALREHAVAAARWTQRLQVREEPPPRRLGLVPPMLDAR